VEAKFDGEPMTIAPIRTFVAAGLGAVLAIALAGCQTPQQAADNAAYACQAAGLRPGSARFERCVNANYAQNRRQNDAAAGALTAGVVSGAVVGAALAGPGPYYGYGYGYYDYGYHPYSWY